MAGEAARPYGQQTYDQIEFEIYFWGGGASDGRKGDCFISTHTQVVQTCLD